LLDIGQYREYFPFVAIRIPDPSLVLECVTTTGLHFISWAKTFGFPAIPNRVNVLGGRYLKSHMGQRARSRMQAFIQGEIEWRILHIEFGITRTDLQRFDSKEPLIELDSCRPRMQRSGQCGLSVWKELHIRLRACMKTIAARTHTSMHICWELRVLELVCEIPDSFRH
jgi:ABC-type transport system involved in cytochrome bd biosynthesis, fused ATPase and permease components